ncbi:MAG: DUF1624 domain-containing protein [Saprospiraceae bacterium]|nr:DUF1624 domain-containing protein [Saprospiraceae bacterium]
MQNNPSARLSSLDILRGFVIVLMVLDHTRDFFGPTPFQPEDMTQTWPALFFTRWITHLCAPLFVFLAGISAWLYGNKVNNNKTLSRYLFTRGLWFVFLEFAVVNLSLMFEWPWVKGFVFVQVLWAIGCSMIVLSALIHLPMRWIAGIGLVMVAGHNLLDRISADSWGSFSWLWKVLHVGGGWIPFNESQSFGLIVAYPLIPWIGVMALGYVFGPVMRWEAAKRQRFLWQMGAGLILFFIALRATNLYGDLKDWAPQERGAVYSLLSFLNATKYPPSLLYLCMTIGPGLLLLLLFERTSGPVHSFLRVYGQVPFFFYLIHFSLIHALSAMYFGWEVDFFFSPPDTWPPDYVQSLGLVYVVWLLFIGVMYLVCRWYGKYKFSHDYWWLKYV